MISYGLEVQNGTSVTEAPDSFAQRSSIEHMAQVSASYSL